MTHDTQLWCLVHTMHSVVFFFQLDWCSLNVERDCVELVPTGKVSRLGDGSVYLAVAPECGQCLSEGRGTPRITPSTFIPFDWVDEGVSGVRGRVIEPKNIFRPLCLLRKAMNVRPKSSTACSTSIRGSGICHGHRTAFAAPSFFFSSSFPSHRTPWKLTTLFPHVIAVTPFSWENWQIHTETFSTRAIDQTWPPFEEAPWACLAEPSPG